MKSDKEKKLENAILRHKKLYYSGHPIISDIEYDALEEQLKEINKHNFALRLIGSSPGSTAKVAHESKMLSLEKTYDLNELKKWMGNNDLLSLYKIDGVSCSLIYINNKLILAKTRGDGSFGEDITEKCRWINEIPKDIKSIDEKLEIRGEIFCTEDNFLSLSLEMEKRKLDRPTSQRNIVAGLMLRKDNLDLSSYLSFNAFDLISRKLISTEHEKLETLQRLGFKIPDYEVHKNFKTVSDFIKKSSEFIEEGQYQIDGVVFVIDDIEKQNSLGVTSHHPKYKLAYKFKGESKETTILDIQWSVSRNGILTPVARVEATELSGATVENVTLHNFGIVRQFKLKKGDRISIVRSGEVIPKFLEVIKSVEGEIKYPKSCPSCSQRIYEKDIRLVCENPLCPGKNKEMILNFIHKIGIEDLSDKRLEEMINVKMVRQIPDLYKLNVSDLLTLDKTKETMANKLYQNIQKTLSVDLVTFLSSLGISGGAFNKCQKIVRAGFDSVEKILNLKHEDLLGIESFAEKSSEDFLKSLAGKKELIRQLLDVGMTFAEKKQESLKLEGKSFCITGALSEKREVIEEKIRQNGGRVLSSVSKNLDYLVCNEQEGGSSKYEKAQKLNIKIISEEKLKTYLEKASE